MQRIEIGNLMAKKTMGVHHSLQIGYTEEDWQYWTSHLVYLLVAGPGQGHDHGSGGAELHALHRGGHVAVCTPVQHLELSCPAPCPAP